MTKAIFVFLIGATFLFASCGDYSDSLKGAEKNVEKHYGEQIEEYSEMFELPPEYLKALAVIESAGYKNIKPRFEEKVYKKLKKVQKRQMKNYENVTHDILKNVPDSVIRDMAKSWGPFQLMGYKCTWIGIDIEELKRNSVKWGVYWIDKSYGKLLRQGKFKDAFHMHNSGKMYPSDGDPLTHDPDYVDNGLRYMKKFRKMDSLRNIKRNKVIISIEENAEN